jgi:hypothetical protein
MKFKSVYISKMSPIPWQVSHLYHLARLQLRTEETAFRSGEQLRCTAVFLNLPCATDPRVSLVGAADTLPKTISYIFIKHNRLTKLQNHTNIITNYGNKFRAGRINSVSYEVSR